MPSTPRDRDRALGMLVRKGYELELAYDALRRYSGPTRRWTERPALRYARSVRGRPKPANTLVSENHVMAEIRSPSSVSTKSP